ncbi:MAG: hypothetical protein UZ07_CHB004000916 [Chlorobi bacterium OLB7]|nr:MAG: hypothetical protein UZ07_CHB004000916 [Chlorobi bacterium OLB7]
MDRIQPSPAVRIGRSPAILELGDERLSSLAKPSMKVVIAFTDATRSSPDRLLVGHLLRQLSAAGVPLGNITLLCATGLHRPMTSREAVEKLGEEIAQTVRIINHTATEKESLAELGTIDGVPVTVNNLCLQADLLLATGVVEPHQYAGYSGGAKTVAIGCGGEPTIQATHGVAMLDSEGVRLGKIEANPFQEFVRRAGERIGLRYVANALLDHEGAIVACAAGPPTGCMIIWSAWAAHCSRSRWISRFMRPLLAWHRPSRGTCTKPAAPPPTLPYATQPRSSPARRLVLPAANPRRGGGGDWRAKIL